MLNFFSFLGLDTLNFLNLNILKCEQYKFKTIILIVSVMSCSDTPVCFEFFVYLCGRLDSSIIGWQSTRSCSKFQFLPLQVIPDHK